MTTFVANPSGYPLRIKEGSGISISENLSDIQFSYTGTVNTLAGLSDVTITSPITSDMLSYNSGTWVNTPASNFGIPVGADAQVAFFTGTSRVISNSNLTFDYLSNILKVTGRTYVNGVLFVTGTAEIVAGLSLGLATGTTIGSLAMWRSNTGPRVILQAVDLPVASGGLVIWKNNTPTKAVNLGLSVPGFAAGDDIVLSTFDGSTWVENARIRNNGGLNLGTGTALVATAGQIVTPGSITGSSAIFGALEIQSYSVNNNWVSDNLYYAANAWKYRGNGFGQMLYFAGGGTLIRRAPNNVSGTGITAILTDTAYFDASGTAYVYQGLNVGSASGATTGQVYAKQTAAAQALIAEISVSDDVAYNAIKVLRTRTDSTAPAAGFGIGHAFNLEGFTNGSEAAAGRLTALWENTQTNDTTDRDSAFVIYTMLDNAIGEAARFTSGKNLTIQGVLNVGSNQVVSTRKTGWTAATNTKARTTFDTTTVTLPNLAARVGALIDDLISHGLIGA